MTETGWLSIGTLVFGAVSTGIGFIFKALLNAKDSLITILSEENKAHRAKIDELQNKINAQIQTMLDTERKRAETDQVIARSISEQSAKLNTQSELISKLLAGKATA